jgi:hypothetical protein
MAAKKKKKIASKFATTPVKRSHLIANSGVGSVIRLRNGTTALVAGLASWEKSIVVGASSGEHEHRQKVEEFLRQYLIRDPELETATGVQRFYQPPRAPSESENTRDQWQIPAIVFPRSSVCENFRCGSVRTDIPDSGKMPDCDVCDPVSSGRKKTKFRKRQSPIFLVCTNGHISEINWGAEIEHNANCPGAVMSITNSSSVHSPKLECKACGAFGKLAGSRPCNGSRAWLVGAANEHCQEKMHVVNRTSVQVYFAQSKSSIHVPPRSGIDPDVIDWILTNKDFKYIKADNPEDLNMLRIDLQGVGKDVPIESVRRHLEFVKEVTSRRGADEEWDSTAARAHELDVFLRSTKDFVVLDGRFLEFHETDLSRANPAIFGPDGFIERVVCLTRMTETRVQDGFTRYNPTPVSPMEGFELMWGHLNRDDAWLPAYRAYGEGILFLFNSEKLSNCDHTSVASDDDPKKGLSERGVFAHSLAHLMMTRLSQDCGYPLPSIRDRMYDLPDGRIAVLIYTADSDILGTLGGLVEFGEGQKIESLVTDAISAARWCSQDPVCIGRVFNGKRHQGSCCHQCLFLPETSCELMNQFLDRASITGSRERNIRGVLNQP